jgi:hypothetical protein
MTNFNITSDEHLEFIAAKEAKRKPKAAGKKPTCEKMKKQEKKKKREDGPQTTATKQQKLPRKKKGAKPSKSKGKKSQKQKSGGHKECNSSATSSEPCLYCKETFSTDKWIQCQMCHMWAHYECAGVDDGVFNFVCEVCE